MPARTRPLPARTRPGGLPENPISLNEAVAQLREPRSTVRRWIDMGLLPAWRVGPVKIVVSQADVNRLIVRIPASSARRAS